MYILYGGMFTRALMVEMVLAEGDIDYELRQIDIIAQQHRSPEFLAINPAGWVPALITPEGETLYETPAINLYLAERHGLTHIAPRADEPERGRFLSGLFYLTDDLEHVMKRYFYPHRYVLRTEDAQAIKQRSLESALERYALIEQRLGKTGPYHLGDRFSLVDIITVYWAVTFDAAVKFDPYPSVVNLMTLVMNRPKLRPKFDEMIAWRARYEALQARGPVQTKPEMR